MPDRISTNALGQETAPCLDKLLLILRTIFPPACHEQIFLVGGSVRNHLLQQAIADIDLVAVMPEHLLLDNGFRLVQGRTTTPIWFRHDNTAGSIELVRLDDLCQLEPDLRRRDFTVNAIALSLSGRLLDPLQGQTDIPQRLLRPCSTRCFHDDPLRIVRAFRFAADGWQISQEAQQMIKEGDWTVQLADLPVERFSREMVKALAGNAPDRFFELLVNCRLGSHWLPELFRMPAIPAGPLQHHPEGDLLTHSLQVLQRTAAVTNDPLARFCALFHDIGKLSTDPARYPKHHGHDEAGFLPAQAFCTRLCLPSAWGKALAWTSRLHTHLNRWHELRDATRLRIAGQARKAGITEILPFVSAADKPGNRIPADWQQTVTIAAMNSEQLGIKQEQLETLPVNKRTDLLQQKRIELLRHAASESLCC